MVLTSGGGRVCPWFHFDGDRSLGAVRPRLHEVGRSPRFPAALPGTHNMDKATIRWFSWPRSRQTWCLHLPSSVCSSIHFRSEFFSACRAFWRSTGSERISKLREIQQSRRRHDSIVAFSPAGARFVLAFSGGSCSIFPAASPVIRVEQY
jgi:hypothetical protein